MRKLKLREFKWPARDHTATWLGLKPGIRAYKYHALLPLNFFLVLFSLFPYLLSFLPSSSFPLFIPLCSAAPLTDPKQVPPIPHRHLAQLHTLCKFCRPGLASHGPATSSLVTFISLCQQVRHVPLYPASPVLPAHRRSGSWQKPAELGPAPAWREARSLGSYVTCSPLCPDVCLQHHDFPFLHRDFNVMPRRFVWVDFDDNGPERERQRENHQVEGKGEDCQIPPLEAAPCGAENNVLSMNELS